MKGKFIPLQVGSGAGNTTNNNYGDPAGACRLQVDNDADPADTSRYEIWDNIRLWMRNHTPAPIVNWRWEPLFCFFIELVMTAFFALVHFSSNYLFPGASVGNPSTRGALIGIAAAVTHATGGRFTTMYLDPVNSAVGGFSYILTRDKIASGGTWQELIKIPFFWIPQWLGWMLGAAFLGLWTGTAIKTSDCSLEPILPAICDVYPVRDVFVTTSSLNWMEAIAGGLVIYGFKVCGERAFGWTSPGIYMSATLTGVGHYMAHTLWGAAAGGSFNFWYWAISAWFSGLSIDAISFIWPRIVAVCIIGVIDVVVYYVVMRFLKPSALSEAGKLD